MEVFGIYSGSIHEGGGVDNHLFYQKESAMKNLLKQVEKKNKWFEDANKDFDCDFQLYEEMENGVWENGTDVIAIQVFKII